MNKQRKYILIASAVGIIAMFLPWFNIFLMNVNGMHGRGIFVFLCFAACGVMALMGDQKLNLDKTLWMVTLIAGGIAALIMIITFFDAMSAIVNMLSYGFYLALLASIGVLLAAYIFRTPGQSIKSGFDSLKKDIRDKTKSNPPS